MSTGKTKNIQLNQWEPQDDFLRAEFNEDNQKIDAAVQTANEAIQTTNAAIAELSAAIRTADAAIETLNTSVQGLNTAVRDAGTAIQDINTAMQDTDAVIQSMNAAIGDSNDAIKDANAAIRDIGYVTLLDVTTASDAAQVDLDLSGIDFTQFWKVELFVDCKVSGSLYIRTSGVSTGYNFFGFDSSASASQPYLNYFYEPVKRVYYSIFTQPVSGMPVAMSIASFYQNGTTGGNNHFYGISPVTWDALTSFNFYRSSGNVPAGTRFALKGVKR